MSVISYPGVASDIVGERHVNPILDGGCPRDVGGVE